MGNIYNNIVETVGRTPLVKLNRVTEGLEATIAVKCEYFNPLGSVKDRIGMAMIEEAEKSGKLTKETTIVEPTSGNTGIALAFVAAAKGYKTHPDHAGNDEHGTAHFAGHARREARPHRRGQGHERRHRQGRGDRGRNAQRLDAAAVQQPRPTLPFTAQPRRRKSGTTPMGKSIFSSPRSAPAAPSPVFPK